jgi:hypothetical protein
LSRRLRRRGGNKSFASGRQPPLSLELPGCLPRSESLRTCPMRL